MSCKYGKLKNPSGGRRCKLRRSSGKRRSRRSSSRGLKIAGLGVGTLAVMAVGAVGAYKYWESQGA